MKAETKILIVITTTLVLLGILMIYSVGALRDAKATLFLKHLVYVTLGTAGFLIMMHKDYHDLGKPSMLRFIVISSLVLLALTFIPPFRLSMGGASRWIGWRNISFQPSEFAKFALVLLLAVRLTQHQERIRNFGAGFVLPFFLAGIFVSIVLLQKDIGIPFVMLAATFVMAWVAGVRKLYLLGSVGICGICGSALIAMYPYRLDRVWALADPWKYRDTIGYQLIQSLAAFSQGEFWGQGAGAGEQKLGYLPAAHTDFVFAMIGEELGLFGAVITLLLFAGMLYVALRIAANAPDLFGSLLAVGITMLITIQAVFIMAVTVGLVPTKGLPLPFVSYGGSSLVVTLAMMGILTNIGIQAELKKELPKRRLSSKTKIYAPAFNQSKVVAPLSARFRV